jgi:hypothetical protein
LLSKIFTVFCVIVASSIATPARALADNALTKVISLAAEGEVRAMRYSEKMDCATELAKLVLARYWPGTFVEGQAHKDASISGILGGTPSYSFIFTDRAGERYHGWMYVNFENRINQATGRRYAYACAVAEMKAAGSLFGDPYEAERRYFDNVDGKPSTSLYTP